jgi:hypothetical protein
MSSNPKTVCCCLAAAVLLVAISCTPPQNEPEQGPAGSPATTTPAPEQVPSIPATGDLLPDLTMLPLEAFHMAYDGDRKVLRFDAVVVNVGKGPLDVTGTRPSVIERDLKVTQNVLQADGDAREVETEAVMRYEKVDGHDHFHLLDFQRYRLRPADSTEWRGSRKEGWCLVDDGSFGGQPSRYNENEFDCGFEEENDALEVRQGLSEGWADVYDWYLEGQYIELDDYTLPGDFCVAADADPEQLLTEATRENNATSTLVHVSENDVSVIREGC